MQTLRNQKSVETIYTKLKKCTNYVKANFIQRNDTIELITVALLTKSHLLLEGAPGIAKSDVVRTYIRSVFRDYSDWFFDLQFSTRTVSEDIFGPMKLSVLKDEHNPRVEYNTRLMFPECRVALLDEVFRGQSRLLTTMFQVMVERIFKNGQELMSCPLSSCFGTTNFTTDDDELIAFLDRWDIRHNVVGLRSVNEFASLGKLYVGRSSKRGAVSAMPEELRLTWSEFELLQNLVLEKVIIPEEVVDLYANVFFGFKSAAVSETANWSKYNFHQPSDRMFYNTLTLIAGKVVAAALNESASLKEFEVSIEDIIHAQLGWTIVGNSEMEAVYNSVYSQQMQLHEARASEYKAAREITEHLEWVEDSLDSLISEEEQLSNPLLIIQHRAELVQIGKVLSRLSEKTFLSDTVYKTTKTQGDVVNRLLGRVNDIYSKMLDGECEDYTQDTEKNAFDYFTSAVQIAAE